jgi:pyrroline-5-carboxylate reductase
VADTLVLAVKPQVMGDVLPTVAPMRDEATLVVSVAAGITCARLGTLGPGPVVRAIPNTPAAVGKGMTAAFAAGASAEQVRLADALLASVGAVAWVEEEALIDAATAVSGSGPAYVFHLVEALAAAGVAEGLSEDVAAALARQTVIGAGALLERSTLDPGTLRSNVTSPGGTTAAALSVLMETGALTDLMTRAVRAAAVRSRELGS